MIITKNYSKSEIENIAISAKSKFMLKMNIYLNILTSGLNKVLFRINREFLITFK
jgi:hypothetical protein